MILSGKRSTIIRQHIGDIEDISPRRVLNYIKYVAQKNDILQMLLYNTRQYTNSFLNRFQHIDQKVQQLRGQIQKQIIKGKTGKQLTKLFNISERSIRGRINQELNQKLTQNNIIQRNKERSQKRKIKIEMQIQKYQSIVLKFIEDRNYDVTIGDIRQQFGKKRFIIPILKRNDLYTHVRRIGKERTDQHRRNIAHLGGKGVKRYFSNRLKKQMQQYQQRFLQLIEDQYYKGMLIQDAKERNISIVAVQKLIQKHQEKVVHYINSKHHRNGMFGVQPPAGSGVGSSGWIQFKDQKMLFRSTLQCRVYCYLMYNNIQFKLSKHRIPYQLNDKLRNYHPDIVIGNTIYQIKPEKMLKLKINIAKFEAARLYCKKYNLQFDIITQNTFPITQEQLTQHILKLYRNGKITFTNKKSEEKFLKVKEIYERTNNTN